MHSVAENDFLMPCVKDKDLDRVPKGIVKLNTKKGYKKRPKKKDPDDAEHSVVSDSDADPVRLLPRCHRQIPLYFVF